jgi:hypothetical protein
MDGKEREEYLVSLRRGKVEQMLAAGASQIAIAQALNVSESTISLDVSFLKTKARNYISQYEEHFAFEYTKALNFLEQIQLTAWQAADKCKYERNLSSLLNVAREAAMNRASLLCDVTLLDRTISYIENIRKKRKHVLGLVGSTSNIDTVSAIDSNSNDNIEDTATHENEDQGHDEHEEATIEETASS